MISLRDRVAAAGGSARCADPRAGGPDHGADGAGRGVAGAAGRGAAGRIAELGELLDAAGGGLVAG
jgi:hypothetical protein